MPTMVYEILHKKKHLKLIARDVGEQKLNEMEKIPPYKKEEERHVLMTFLNSEWSRNQRIENAMFDDFSISLYWMYENREEAENAILEFYSEPVSPVPTDVLETI